MAFSNFQVILAVVAAFIAGVLLVASCRKRIACGASLEVLAEAKTTLSSQKICYWILFIVAIGTLLRFYGISFGLPDNYHPDEISKVKVLLRMMKNASLDPGYFLHPSLLLYLSYALAKFIHWCGLAWDFRDTCFLAGRIVSAIAGSLSIYLTYAIGKRLFKPNSALLGAALLALFPLHVTCSRYMKEDALLTCMVLASVLATLKAVQEEKRWMLLWAGFLCGVAASSKYSGLLCVFALCAAPFLASRSFLPDKRWLLGLLAALCLLPIGFIVCSPYSLINTATFIHDVLREQRHMNRGHIMAIDAWSQLWMYHMQRSVFPGVSLINALAALIGCGVLVWRRRVEDLYLVALIALFYLPAEWVKAKPEPQPERYILPCLPFMALAGSELVRLLWDARLRMLAFVLAGLMIAFPAWRSISLARHLIPDTRQLLAEWMINNLEPGARVISDWWPYQPKFRHSEFQVYFPEHRDILKEIDPLLLKRASKSEEGAYDYLVLSSLFYERFLLRPNVEIGLRLRVRSLFRELPIIKIICSEEGSYAFHNPTLVVFSLKKEDLLRYEDELRAKKRGEIEQTSNERLLRSVQPPGWPKR